MLVCIPTKGNAGLQEEISEHFGSSPCFTFYNSETEELKTIVNRNAHHAHGTCHPLNQISKYKIDCIVCNHMGRRAIEALGTEGIKVLSASKTPAEVCSRIDRRIEIGAERAEEAEIAVADFPGYAEVVDDGGGSDLVSQTAEFFRGDALSHRLSFSPQRLFRGERFGARVS